MFDPAALGTLIIGLNAERAEAEGHPRRRSATRRRETVAPRVTLARGLRRLAAVLDRPPVREVVN